jgi:hypothetical protein
MSCPYEGRGVGAGFVVVNDWSSLRRAQHVVPLQVTFLVYGVVG